MEAVVHETKSGLAPGLQSSFLLLCWILTRHSRALAHDRDHVYVARTRKYKDPNAKQRS